MNRLRRAVLLLTLALTPAPALSQQSPPQISPEAVANPPGLPSIGKWMIDRTGAVAHWLGEMVDGKRLYEPINVILIVDAGPSAPPAGAKGAAPGAAPLPMTNTDAVQRLVAAARAAGYPVRLGHSTGYRGLIGGALYAQLPQGRDDAFSNRVFELSNNHGRVFGPHPFGGSWLFVAAFSRERVDPLKRPGHRYASFNQARDDFAKALVSRAGWQAAAPVPLGNAIASDPQITTGDHDGMAVVVRSRSD